MDSSAKDDSGSCYCKKISFVITGSPKLVANCHCDKCRALIGSAFSTWVTYNKQCVTWKGIVREYSINSDSLLKFCGNCGTQLAKVSASDPDEIRFLLGALENCRTFFPRRDDFPSQKLSWLTTQDSLQKELQHWKKHPTMALGIKGELLISRKILGSLTSHKATHDYKIDEGQKFEIKTSDLNQSNPNAPNSLRWAWGRVSGVKEYDWLLLLGEPHLKYTELYQYPENAYVTFLIPRAEVDILKNKSDGIQLNSNPSVKGFKAAKLYNDFQVDLDMLSEIFE